MSNKFSIVIPTFENSDYLNLCINSILKNSHFSYSELLVAATDYRGFGPSEEIYTSLKYDGGLKFIRNKKTFC